MIPTEAVEAAAKVLLGDELGREVEELEGELWSDDIEARKDLARAALEAAAPHIRGQALEDAAANIDQWIKAGADEPVHPWETSKWLRSRAGNLLNNEGEK